MFPFRYSSIFKSRWIALAWAGGIVSMAASFAGDHKPTPTGNGESTDDVDTARSIQDAAKALEGISGGSDDAKRSSTSSS